jgi:ABC-2 type transport system ATP-binding protein
VLYTTHYMEEAQELSDRVGIIDHGELIALGTQAELTQQVGEMETLILHVDAAEDPQALVEAVKTTPTVLCAEAIDSAVTLVAPSAEDILAEVITRANARGIKIRTLEIQEPNLEAVFLQLTGRALRD